MLVWKTRSDGCEFADTGGHGRCPMRGDPNKMVLNLNGGFIGTFTTRRSGQGQGAARSQRSILRGAGIMSDEAIVLCALVALAAVMLVSAVALRKPLRVTVGGITVEGENPADIEKLLALARKFESEPPWLDKAPPSGTRITRTIRCAPEGQS